MESLSWKKPGKTTQKIPTKRWCERVQILKSLSKMSVYYLDRFSNLVVFTCKISSHFGSRSCEKMDVAVAEAVCYVCYGDGKEEALISPCAGCRGSTAFIHFSCLRDFVGQRGDWANLVCPTCKYAYEGEAAVKLAEEGLGQTRKRHYGCPMGRKGPRCWLRPPGRSI